MSATNAATMTMDQARRFVMPFGKYRSRTLDEINSDGEGLRYLDWLVDQPFVRAELKQALKTYLADPVVKRELDAAIDD